MFVGRRYSEGIQGQLKNTHFPPQSVLRHLSIGDVATLRRQPVNGTVMKDSEAHRLRSGSIQSLPNNITQYSAISNTGCALNQQGRAAAEAIYATPMQPECPNDVDLPPPVLPAPVQFQSATSHSEVIPIATKVHHTYANVSEAVRGAKSAGSVESSFRPGENACLSSAVDSAVNRDANSAAVSVVEDAAVGCSSVSSCYSINSVASSSLNSSVSSLSYLPASVSSPSCSISSPLPPPSFPRRGVKQTNGLRVGSTSTEASKKLVANVGGLHANATVSLSHNHRDVTADELQRDYPPQRLLYGPSHTRDGKQSTVAPLKMMREDAQVAQIARRSRFSVDDDAAREKVVDQTMSADSSEDMHCGFLLLAERARQEYIRRRASVIGCEEQPGETCTTDVPARPAAAAQVTGGEFKRLIAQKAGELQRNRITAVSEQLVVNRESAPSSNGSHIAVSDSAFFPQLGDGNVDANQHNSDVFNSHRGSNGVPASVLLHGETLFGFQSDISELEPCNDQLVVLPFPPPDFADSVGANPSNTGLGQSSALFSLNCCAIDRVPSPPPEFNDSPNHGGGNFRCRPVAMWSVSDVSHWLDSLHMSGHCDSFAAHSVDGHRLMELGRSELIALGVTQVGQRMNLERAIKRAVMSVPSCNS